MNRKYTEYVNPALIILQEVFIHGKSKGWSGSLENLEQTKESLKPFNVAYTCDFTGTWTLKNKV